MAIRATTLFEKLWRQHVVAELDEQTSLLHIDRVFLHERTGSIALASLEQDGRTVRHPELAFCTMDHIVDTSPTRGDDTPMPGGREFIRTTREAARRFGLTLFDIHDPNQGIVHVISPELGIVLPAPPSFVPTVTPVRKVRSARSPGVSDRRRPSMRWRRRRCALRGPERCASVSTAHSVRG
jgi:3-isopropylmalate dehydratase, large subunit (EC 4.2.1.33)